jgi:nitrogen regulatory protein P-II 1
VKAITAIIRPFKVADVVSALRQLGAHGLTVTEVRGFGRQRGHTEVYRGAEYVEEFNPKIRIDIVVDEDDVSDFVTTIVKVAGTGKIGDGKLWVTPVESVIRVRTGERGADAI